MSDTATPVFRRLNQTPLRDLLRGRITGRLDWKSRLTASGLPADAAGLIARVVKQTRLFRLEKADVADELLAHFLDGLAAGSSAAHLVEGFGDERMAARLIRRAKLRSRSLPWRAWRVALRAMATLAAIYSVFLVRFCLSRPTPTVDYLAKLNQPITQTAPGDRAWPLWRQAILASSNALQNGEPRFPQAISLTQQGFSWEESVKWLDAHAVGVELARQAGRKTALGFVLGPGGSGSDPEMRGWGGSDQEPGQPLVRLLLPHLQGLSGMAELLTLDARRAAEKGDGAVAEADIMAMLGLSRQLREADGILVTQLVGLRAHELALDRVRLILFNSPGSLTNDELIRLAHAVSGPEVAADLINLKGERYIFDDIVQRVYTDDGHGDGHVTESGLRTLQALLGAMNVNSSDNQISLNAEVTSTVPLTASRAELMGEYDRLMDQQEANLHSPARQIDIRKVESELIALKNSPVDRVRYAILVKLMPVLSHTQACCERILGQRDGVLVGIALELHRRHHGRFPASLGELTPDLLPNIPADRITGDPVMYRLIDGKPVVYSVGADRVDNGGSALDIKGRHNPYTAASWGDDPANAPRGDWLLFALEPPEEAGN